MSKAASSWTLALVTITAYSFNSQLFVWIGEADFGGKLFELFLFHVGGMVFLLYFAAFGGLRKLLAEHVSDWWAALRLIAQVQIGAFFLMEIYYLWFLASLRLPTQLLAAIFQSAIAFVYLLSMIFLGERFSRLKVSGVCLAVLGVVTASFSHEWLSETDFDEGLPRGWRLTEGVLLAVGAEISKACYQVWFKTTFGEPQPRFALLFGSLVGLAHLTTVLPLLAVLGAFGVEDARMVTASPWTWQQGCLVLLAAAVAAAVNVGSLAVVALRSPLFWSSVQTLAIPISVVFDLLIRGIRPHAANCIGYALILAAFYLLAVLAPRLVEGEEARAMTIALVSEAVYDVEGFDGKDGDLELAPLRRGGGVLVL